MSFKKILFRGGYELPAQAQALKRDVTGGMVAQYLGEKAIGYMLANDQIDRQEAKHGKFNFYHILINGPGPRSAQSWKAFYTIPELKTFCHAYGIEIEGKVEPGRQFKLVMPTSIDNFDDLHFAIRYQNTHGQTYAAIDDETRNGIVENLSMVLAQTRNKDTK